MCAHATGSVDVPQTRTRHTEPTPYTLHPTHPTLQRICTRHLRPQARVSKLHVTFERCFCWLLRVCVPLLALVCVCACVRAAFSLSLLCVSVCLPVSCLLASLLPVIARRPPSSRSKTPRHRVNRHKRVCFSAHGPASCRRRTQATTEHRRCEDVRAGSTGVTSLQPTVPMKGVNVKRAFHLLAGATALKKY